MVFQIQRIQGCIYGTTSDGSIQVKYPARDEAKVAALLEAAKILCPEDDHSAVAPPFEMRVLASGTNLAASPAAAAAAAPEETKAPKKTRHRVAKKLVDDKGQSINFTEWVDAELANARNGRIPIDRVVEGLGAHYENDRTKVIAALRVAAFQTGRFSLAGDSVVARVVAKPKAG